MQFCQHQLIVRKWEFHLQVSKVTVFPESRPRCLAILTTFIELPQKKNIVINHGCALYSYHTWYVSPSLNSCTFSSDGTRHHAQVSRNLSHFVGQKKRKRKCRAKPSSSYKISISIHYCSSVVFAAPPKVKKMINGCSFTIIRRTNYGLQLGTKAGLAFSLSLLNDKILASLV